MTEAQKSGANNPLSPLKQAFLALEQAQARIRELENASHEPIAVVGIGCRIPGDEDSVNGYWRLLQERRSAVSNGVERRLSDSLRGRALPMSARSAAMLERVDLFDPRHFGISPREAIGMDPQQRLLLEVSWEALENAGIDPSALYQSATGVYMGLASHDYAQLQMRSDNEQAINPHFASGIASSVAAGRISYVLGLNGPSLSIDTACSSSLVAVHLACESLRHRECTVALAGGVNLILSPEPSIAFAQAGMLSATGKVRAFDSRADGFVRGEGCGVVVLKLLGEAERRGDRILGVILGSAVNQDGASSGLTVPNGLAQQALLREAHRRAGIEAWQVGYVEAHGTGTSLGDPIEAEALGAVFAGRQQKLLIGSVKTNVGHLESAAGVAGLIKVVLGLQHGVVPGQLHWEGPSEHVRWSKLALEVVTHPRPWEPIAGRRIGGVSSFGFSGTNAHVVVEGWQEAVQQETGPQEEVLVITARSEAALRELAERYAEFLAKSEAAWSDICYTASIGRAVFGERLAVVAMEKSEGAEQLQGWLRGESRGGVYRGEVSAGQRAVSEALSSEASAQTVAAQFVRGTTIEWASRWTDRKPRRVALPTYAFQRERYWIDPVEGSERESGERTGRDLLGRGLLGRRLRAAGVRGQYESLLSAKSWIGEHVVEGRVVLPATGHLELMLEAAAEVSSGGCLLEDVVLQSPLVIEGERRVQTVVEAGSEGRSRVRVYAEQAGGEWERVSEGWLPVGATEAQKSERIDVEAIQARLQARAPGASFYAEMSARGLEFGACFRGVKQVWTGEGEALGEIAVVESAVSGFELQPWWLDACLQVAGLAGSGEDESLYLPMSLDRLEVYAPSGQGSEMNPDRSWSHVTTRRIDPDTLAAEVTITHPNGLPRLRIHNLRFRKIANKTADVASWMYRLDWQQEERLSDAQTAAIPEIAEDLKRRAEQLSRSETIAKYNAFFAELEDLAAVYVLEAFRQLGWPQTANPLSARALQDRWKIDPQHGPLLQRLLEIAVEKGAVRCEAQAFSFGKVPPPTSSDLASELARRFPFGSTEIDLVARCGKHLSEVLTGKIDGRELVFARGQTEEMKRLYRDSVPARIYNEMLGEVVGRVATARGGAATRILEIGGGTGATTHYVLGSLQSAGQVPDDYLFTDISPLLVRQAEQNFRDSAFLRTKVFDLERDGIAQGIEGSFSIILAVNVLHATTDLSATLDRLKSLLAPDGALVLVEVTGKQRWADITVGLLDGWWSFADHQLRPDYPSLENGAWQALLEKSGFGRVITIPESADQQSIFGWQELIIADGFTQPRRVAVVGDGELVDEVALHLRQRHADVRTTTAENLTHCLHSYDTLDALLWVSEQTENFDRVSSGLASKAAENSIRSLLNTTQVLLKLRTQSPMRLYVVTSGACAVVSREPQIQLTATPLVGLAAAIATEVPELRCTRLDCSNLDTESNAADVAAEVLSNVSDQWVAWRAGKRYVARLRRLSASSAEHDAAGRVQLKSDAGIEGLEYIPSTRRELQPDEVEIIVHATALNFRDVLQSLGVIKLDAPIGTDCAGVILRTGGAVTDLAPGDEIVAIAAGCFASHAITPRELIIRKPEKLSFAEAAAQSVAYLTADYCLNEIGRVRSRERVLIHAAAGGVGLAALHLCQKAGAEVIATAGSDRKRAFLRSLGVEHVYDSRSLDFAKQISGKLDIVLNSLAAGGVDAGMELLKPDGRFIELGKTDLRDPALVAKKWPGVQYLPVDLTPLFTARSPWVAARLSMILNEVAAGLLPLLPTSVFASAEVREAFRSMARAEHIGRIVVVQRKDANRFNGTHLITGGMRGIGLKLAEWLSENGARELVLLGRHAPQAAAGEAIARLRAKGVSVKVLQGDIAVPEIAARAVQLAGANLRGVWHSAGVLDNAHIEEQSWERMHTVFRPKVDGAWNLHTLTLGMRLDYFVLFSSWASIGGSYGQANHCAANAFLDGLAHFRRAQGLPALSVNWGAWGETGAASGDEVGRQLARSGMRNMPPAGALEALRQALGSNRTQVAISAIDWPRYLRQRHGDLHSSFYTDFITGHEAGHERQKSKDSRTASGHTGLLGAISARSTTSEAILALPAPMREAALFRTCGDLVRKTLDLHSDEEIDPDVPLGDLGMDSLLAIELRNGLSGVLSRQFPSTILFDYPTLRTLVRYLEQELLSVNQVTPAIAPASAVIVAADTKVNSLDILDTIEQMSDDEVESWFQ